LPERLGIHRSEAIQAAATRLEGEGFVELRDAEIRVRP
jgi:hypothetical protein